MITIIITTTGWLAGGLEWSASGTISKLGRGRRTPFSEHQPQRDEGALRAARYPVMPLTLAGARPAHTPRSETHLSSGLTPQPDTVRSCLRHEWTSKQVRVARMLFHSCIWSSVHLPVTRQRARLELGATVMGLASLGIQLLLLLGALLSSEQCHGLFSSEHCHGNATQCHGSRCSPSFWRRVG